MASAISSSRAFFSADGLVIQRLNRLVIFLLRRDLVGCKLFREDRFLFFQSCPSQRQVTARVTAGDLLLFSSRLLSSLGFKLEDALGGLRASFSYCLPPAWAIASLSCQNFSS